MNHFMYMDDINLSVKNDKELETIRIYSQNIRMEFSIEKCAMLIMRSGKTKPRRNKTAKSRKNSNTWRKRKLQVLRNIGNGHIKQVEMKG